MPSTLFDTTPSGAKLARKREHGRPVFRDVFVEQDAGFEIAQQLRQHDLPVQEWEIAQILAIKLDQVESIEDCGLSGLSAGQLREPSQAAVRTQNNRLAVNREPLGLDHLGGSRDRRQSHSPVIYCGCRAAQWDRPDARSSGSRHV
jgi:hypothetical protein